MTIAFKKLVEAFEKDWNFEAWVVKGGNWTTKSLLNLWLQWKKKSKQTSRKKML